MKKPNFFIIGAPKCGTTSLAEWLAEHPAVFFCPEKEPHYFSHDVWQTTSSLDHYEELFANANRSHQVVGEASTHYIYSQLAIQQIEQYSPNARYIVCLRNPIEMAPSVHAERLFAGMETEKSFSKAWELCADRQQGRSVPMTVRDAPLLLDYQHLCALGSLLENLYRQIPKERVLPVFLDDVKEDPAAVYTTLLNFLKIPHYEKTSFAVANPRKVTAHPKIAQAIRLSVLLAQRIGWRPRLGLASRIRNSNVIKIKPKSGKQTQSTIASQLQTHFESDIALLEKLTERDLSHWLTHASGEQLPAAHLA